MSEHGPGNNRRILVIDDNASIHEDFRKVLIGGSGSSQAIEELEAQIFGQTNSIPRREAYEIDSAYQGEEGLAMVRKAHADQRPYAMAFVDIRMPPGWNGIETVARIWNEFPDLQVVICTAYSDYSWDEMVTRLCKSENLLILKKPFDNVEVLQIAAALTEKWRLTQAAYRKTDELEQLVAERTREIRLANEELRAMTAALTAARDTAEAANAAKARFLANISHEIRTPLTAVLGYADLLLEPDQTPEQRAQCVGIIRRHGDNLLQIINDILDLSKMEAGRLAIEPLVCSPAAVLAEVVSLLNVRAKPKNLELAVDCDGNIPAQIRSDPIRLRQILTNVVGNAIKFTERGSVRVIMKLNEPKSGHATLEFAVIDTGIGIEPDVLSNLFTPFTQANDSTSRRFGGTGLGLAISKKLAEALGGGISVQSTPGKGAAFRITVATGPIEGPMLGRQQLLETPAPVQPPAPTASLRLSGRVLLAEDGVDNQRLIGYVLRKAGLHVDVAENGRVAVDKALSGNYDLIIMDMQMPEMDGYSATSLLRQKGYSGPILALTAHAMHTDRQKCISAGCDDYAAKPIDRAALLEAVRLFIGSGWNHKHSAPVA